jgi:methylmalonyl-CoA decarboxylase
MSLVTTELADGIATVTLHDPRKRNALSAELLRQFVAGFRALGAARVVVVRAGREDSVFSAGFDIDALAPGLDPLEPDGLLDQAFAAINNHPAPVLAMVGGSAWGGGADLALRCDIVIGSPAASFAFTPAKLGLPYSAPGLANVALRAGLGIALEMFAAGEPVGAERALTVGLLNHLVAADELEAFTYTLAERIRDNAPLSVTAAKRQLRALAENLPSMMAATAARQQALDSADYREGLAAFRERRQPRFSGR